LSFGDKEVVNQEISKMLDAGIIRESRSPYNFPVLVVPKKDGSKRICVDLRALNLVTVLQHFPLPLIQDVIDGLVGAEYFTLIDLKAGYWQVELDEESKQKTAFSTDRGHYEFNRVPFGLKNAPTEFSRIMSILFGNVVFVKVYLDDIIIFSSSFSSHVEHIRSVLKILEKSGLKINNEKCEWAKRELKILGHIVSNNQVSMDPAKIEAIGKRKPYKCERSPNLSWTCTLLRNLYI